MLMVATIVIMLAVGYAHYRNGLSSACFMLLAVVLSGLMAFNLWEPVADWLDSSFQGGTFAGCEDLIALILIFSVSLFLLRLATFDYFAPNMIDQNGKVQHLGAIAVGLATGYLVSGFLACGMQTLPIDVHFMDYEPRGGTESALRNWLPPDRVWLCLMRNAGAYPLHWKDDAADAEGVNDRYRHSFDRHATFELRYLRYRRTTEARPAMPYYGEFDRELYVKEKPR